MTAALERKTADRQARRQRIQQAAREVFAEHGYAKTSIEKVARRASLSVGAIYLYFRSKEDLYISLLEETLSSFSAEFQRIASHPELAPRAQLESAWRTLVQWAGTDVEGTRTLRLFAQPNIRKQLSQEVAETSSARLREILGALATIVQSGIHARDYRIGDAGHAAQLLWTVFLGLLAANDIGANLDLPRQPLNEAARTSFIALEASLQHSDVSVAEAA